MGGSYSMHWRNEKCIQYLVGKPEEKITLGRPRHKREDNIRMDLKNIRWEVVDWTHLT
jgi:hypothetical protein